MKKLIILLVLVIFCSCATQNTAQRSGKQFNKTLKKNCKKKSKCHREFYIRF